MNTPASGHIARKRFGQHFLTDRIVIEDIVAAISPQRDDALVEIGPGLGAMTQPLSALCPGLQVIELDRDLAARLRQQGHVEVIEGDVLQVDFAALATRSGKPLRVVGNLPYNISTPILFHLLEVASQVQDQHFMLQREVVERMVATPAHKTYGRLSVMLQWRYDMESVLDVAPEAFDPPPRVHSAVVRMTPHRSPAAVDAKVLSALVATAFSMRRKVLRHALEPWLEKHGYTGSFDLRRRAEEVSVDEYVRVAQAVSAPQPAS